MVNKNADAVNLGNDCIVLAEAWPGHYWNIQSFVTAMTKQWIQPITGNLSAFPEEMRIDTVLKLKLM